jgi:hypothetical protein
MENSSKLGGSGQNVKKPNRAIIMGEDFFLCCGLKGLEQNPHPQPFSNFGAPTPKSKKGALLRPVDLLSVTPSPKKWKTIIF